MARSDSQIAELPDVNINTDAQSINTERASLTTGHESCCGHVKQYFATGR